MVAPTESIELNDFSPGIYSDYHATSGNPSNSTNGVIRVKNGAAVIEDTYRCCADQSGALGPLPKAVANKTLAIPAQTTTAYWPTNHLAYYLQDAVVIGPLSPSQNYNSIGANLASEDYYSMAVQYAFWHAPGGDGVASGYYQYNICRLFAVTTATITRDPFFDRTTSRYASGTFPRDIPSGGLAWIRATFQDPVAVANIYPNLAGICGAVLEWAAQTAIVANDQALTTADTDFTGGYYTTSANAAATSDYESGVLWHYPDPADPTNPTYWPNNQDTRPKAPSLIVQHQDRVVVIGKEVKVIANALFPYQDVYSYTAVLDPKKVATKSRPFRTLFGSENPSGAGAIASISTDRLFIVKHTGGGYIVTGDLNNPTIQRLPFIESSYNVVSYPTVTPFGVVYGTRNGVFLWSGGETAEKLSPQIDGFFWNVGVSGGSNYGGSRGRFAWWHPWVMVPNNFMFDTRTKAWWRLDSVIALPPTGVADANGYYNAPFTAYVVNPGNGKLHAFPKLLTHNQNVIDYIFDPTSLATSYSWKSQPLVETRNRLRSFQSLTLTASGMGSQSVTVTLSGFGDDGTAVTPQSETFTFSSSGRPVVLRHNLTTNFVAMDVQVKIVVTGTNVPAAKVHSLIIGTVERMRGKTDR